MSATTTTQVETTVNQSVVGERYLLVKRQDQTLAQDAFSQQFLTVGDVIKDLLPEVDGKYLIKLELKATVISREVNELPFDDHYRHCEEEF